MTDAGAARRKTRERWGDSRRRWTVLDEALAAKKIVSSVVMIAEGAASARLRATFRMADREAGKPVVQDTIFRFASLTKPLMAVLTLSLIERGVMALTDPVTKFLPDFRPKLAGGEEPVITIRHLLTHTSGLRYRFFEPAGGAYEVADISDGMDIPGRTFEDNLQRIASVPLAFPPGAAWAYSVAYDVLGAAIEKATGKPLPDVMREGVTGPLGLDDTSFVVQARGRLAAAYADGAPEPVNRRPPPGAVRAGQPLLRARPHVRPRLARPSRPAAAG